MARIIYMWPIVFPGDEFVSVLSKDLLNFKLPYRKFWLRPCKYLEIPISII